MQFCDAKCSWCARHFFKFVVAREAAHQKPRKKKDGTYEKTTWAQAAATSVKAR